MIKLLCQQCRHVNLRQNFKCCFLILIWPFCFCVGFRFYKIVSSILKHFSLSYLLQIISVPILQIENWREVRVINFKLYHWPCRDSELPFSHEVQCCSTLPIWWYVLFTCGYHVFNGKQEGISQTIISIHNHILILVILPCWISKWLIQNSCMIPAYRGTMNWRFFCLLILLFLMSLLPCTVTQKIILSLTLLRVHLPNILWHEDVRRGKNKGGSRVCNILFPLHGLLVLIHGKQLLYRANYGIIWLIQE